MQYNIKLLFCEFVKFIVRYYTLLEVLILFHQMPKFDISTSILALHWNCSNYILNILFFILFMINIKLTLIFELGIILKSYLILYCSKNVFNFSCQDYVRKKKQD